MKTKTVVMTLLVFFVMVGFRGLLLPDNQFACIDIARACLML